MAPANGDGGSEGEEEEDPMRGQIKRRYKGSWSLIFDPYHTDVQTGGRVRRKRWVTFKGTKLEAQKELTRLLAACDKGDYIEPSKLTVGEWLTEWMAKAINGRKADGTVARYQGILDKSLRPSGLWTIRLQQLKSLDLEAYYASLDGLSGGTRQIHHADLVGPERRRPRRARLPQRRRSGERQATEGARDTNDVLEHCWTVEEAATFLKTAKAAGPQSAALYSTAIDTGARKGEFAALAWADVDLGKGTVTIQRQLLKADVEAPVFGPTKTGSARTVTVSAETVALLRTHKAAQAEVKMQHRRDYRDYGLVFAKDGLSPGAPLQTNNLGAIDFHPLCEAAGVKRIKFHGLRHTSATLLLAAGVAPHVVQRRLGHANVTMTLTVYRPCVAVDAAGRGR